MSELSIEAQLSRLGSLFLLLTILFGSRPAMGQNLPQGFVDELVVGGMTRPVGMAFLPDARVLLLEQQTGRVLVVAGGGLAVAGTIANVVATMTEQGALGIAVDPLWPNWPYVYVSYTHASPSSLRLLRFTASGDLTSPSSTNVTLSDPYLLLDALPDAAPIHQSGTLRFGPDGMLYMSVGDDFSACGAQDPQSLTGAILRLDVSSARGALGSGPPPLSSLAAVGNPYPGTNGQLVWSLGLRNPFRFNVDPIDGTLFIGDVGESTWEELNECTGPGQNFGWPLLEGPNAFLGCAGAAGPYKLPMIGYLHTSGGPNQASILPFSGRYRNIPGAQFAFGPAYEGLVFYNDFWQGFVRCAQFNGSVWLPAPAVAGQPNGTDWATGMGFIPDALQGPDGAIYYVKWAPGSLRRVRPDFGGFQMSILGGNNQVGNGGWPLAIPLTVAYAAIGGAPAVGSPVNFAVTNGSGLLGPQPVLTDALGHASTSFQLPTATSVNPIQITVTAAGAPSVTFQVGWRGLELDYAPAAAALMVTVRHSETNSPFTLGWQLPPAASLGTPWGDVVLDFFNPSNLLGAFDGLGLFGAPSPLFVTGSIFPEWSATVGGIPLTGGVTLLAQAYALDVTRVGTAEAIMISNPVTVTLQ